MLQNLSDFELSFSNASDFETTFSQRVGFGFQSFTMRKILDKKNITAEILNSKIYESSAFEEKFIFIGKKIIFKKPAFEEKIIFRKQILRKILDTKNHVSIQFVQ